MTARAGPVRIIAHWLTPFSLVSAGGALEGTMRYAHTSSSADKCLLALLVQRVRGSTRCAEHSRELLRWRPRRSRR